MTSTTNERWFRVVNRSADLAGTIHTDETARALGYRAAVAGPGLDYLTAALIERWGPVFYERGFVKHALTRPVHDGDELRLAVEERAPADTDECLVDVGFELRDGTRISVGYAGLARSAETAVAPWERAGEPPPAASPAPADDPIPEFPVGMAFPPQRRVFTVEDAAAHTAGDEAARWYTERSPWGGPVVPMPRYELLAFRLISQGSPRVKAPMSGTSQILMAGPVFAGTPYLLSGGVVEKGRRPRTAFCTSELTIATEDGRRVAAVRQKVHWRDERDESTSG
jgi:hypothetical protein